MELRHLRYFVAVAEAENVTRAAGALHVSQPALSRQVRDLESELGFALLKRGARSVSLTEAGRIFLPEARAVLQRAEEAVAKARAAATGGVEALHIGYAMSPTVRILPTALRAFQTRHPRVRVHLHDLSTGEMLSGLRDGTLHLAFLICSTRSLLRGLKSEERARTGTCLAVAPGHPLARRRAATLAEVARHPLLGFSRTEYPDYHEALAALFATAGLKPRFAREHDSVASLIAALEAGDGVAVVTESLACVAGPRLKLVRLTPEPAPFVIAAAWPAIGLMPVGEAFLQCAREAAARG